MATDPPDAAPAVCTTAQAARLLGVSSTTVQDMVGRGELPAWTTPGGHRRIDRAAVLALRAARTVPAAPAAALLVADPDRDACARLAAAVAEGRPRVDLLVVHDALDAMLELGRRRPRLLVAAWALGPVDGLALLRQVRRHRSLDATVAVLAGDVDRAALAARGGLPRATALEPGPPDPGRLRELLAGAGQPG